MAKKKNKPTKAVSKVQNENAEIEKSDVVLSEVKPGKEEKENFKQTKKENKAKAKKAKNDKPKKNFFKSIFSELKKVTWPKFKEVVKQTGIVLVVVIVFALVLFGLDRLCSWLVGFLF